MRAFSWLLARWPYTQHLAALDRPLRAELALRAQYAGAGLTATPQQRPPSDLFIFALATLAVAISCALRYAL